MNVSFAYPWTLVLLLAIPLLGMVMVAFSRWQKEKKEAFTSNRFKENFFKKEGKAFRLLPLLYLVSIGLLVIALADVLGGRAKTESTQSLSNVIFVLDVSNSMNAEDIDPSRLVMARNLVLQTMEQYKEGRVGLIAFAGDARSLMPLTTDFSAIGPYVGAMESSTIKMQGTDFLKAVEEAVKKFKSVPKGSRQMVLVSDGEDNEGNDKAALQLAKKEGIRILSVGVGTAEGAPVPEYLYGQLLGYKTSALGETVISQRQEDALRSLARGTGGVYIDGNDLNQSTTQLLRALKEDSGKTSFTVETEGREHYFAYFLLPALLLLFLIYFFNPKGEVNL